MGKKSLLKSTSKKKKSSPKPAAGEQIDKTKTDSAKKAVPGKPARKTPKPKADKPVKKKSPHAKKDATPRAVKPPGGETRQNPPTIAELLALKFDAWRLDVSGTTAPPPVAASYTAPSAIDPSDREVAERVRKLLALTFDMETIAAKARTTSAAPPESTAPAVDPDAATDSETDKDRKPALRPLPRACPDGYPLLFPAARPSITSGKLLAGLLAVAVVYLVLIHASAANRQHFYIQPTRTSLNIYQGAFSPAGKKLIMEMPGMSAPVPARHRYTREEIFPLVHRYRLQLALGQLEASPFPDMAAIRAGLEETAAWAVTKEQKALLQKQQDSLTFISLLYKSDVAVRAGNLEAAREYLRAAATLSLDPEEALLIDNKLTATEALVGR